MNWKKYTLLLLACAPLMLSAADYKTHQTAFRTALKKNKTEEIAKEAEAMVNLSKDPKANKAPSMTRTLTAIIKDLKGKPVYTLDLTRKYYAQLIAALPPGYEQECVKIEQAEHLNRLTLLDDAALGKVYDAALKVKDLKTVEKVKLMLMRGNTCITHEDFVKIREQAFKAAGDDPVALVAVYQASLMNGRELRPDAEIMARKMVDDQRIQRALFGTISRECRGVFHPTLGFSYPVKKRIELLEYILSKNVWDKAELCSIHSRYADALARTWERYYAPEDPVKLKKAYASRKYCVEYYRTEKNTRFLLPAYLDLLYVSLIANDQKQFEADAAALAKDCAAERDQWFATVESARAVFAYRQENYQKAYDIAKTINTAKFHRSWWHGSALFMDAYARSACALELYNEAYALRDEYIKRCVPNWYYQQINRVKAQFENIKLMCK